jgi:DNA topoisomerase-1
MGKSSIQFLKVFKISKLAYENLKTLCSKTSSKEIFKNVDATSLNGYLKTLLPNLTAKVFRTYKSSSILQKKLEENKPDINDPVYTKKMAFNTANIEAALALNHKKLNTDTDKQVTKLKEKMKQLKEKRKDAKTDKQKETVEKNIKIMESKIMEAELNISTITSKSNYSDPRITVQWAKVTETPIEQLYNRSQLTKFVWSMDTALDWTF